MLMRKSGRELNLIQPFFFESTIQGALDMAKKIGKDHGSVQTLVTGSQHLVGGALSLIE